MQVNITLDQLPQSLEQISKRLATLTPVMKAGRLMAESEVKLRFQNSTGPLGQAWKPLRYPRPHGGAKPLLNLGLLRGSITGRSDADSITIGTDLEYARLHQFGGTVTPKKGKFLTIPMTKEAVRAGGARRFSRPLRAVVTRGGTRGVLRDDVGVVQYLLVKKSEVPARPFLGFSEQWKKRFEAMLTNYLTTGKLS